MTEEHPDSALFPSCQFAGRLRKAVGDRFCNEPEIGAGGVKRLEQCQTCCHAGSAGKFTPPPRVCIHRTREPIRPAKCSCDRAQVHVYGCGVFGECVINSGDRGFLKADKEPTLAAQKPCQQCPERREVAPAVFQRTDRLLCVLAFCERDRGLAANLLRWIGELGGCRDYDLLLIPAHGLDELPIAREVFREVVVTRPPFALPDESWPKGPNWMFAIALQALEHDPRPFLWLEPDCIPYRAGWLEALEAEYLACDKRYMGRIVTHAPGPPHLTGCAIYPPGCYGELIKHTRTEWAWDAACHETVVPQAHDSALMFHRWGTEPGEPEPQHVFGHQDKTGEVIRELRRKRGAPMGVPCLTYYQRIPGDPPHEPLIDLWRESWEPHGWECVVLSEKDAQKHPRFSEILAIANSVPTFLSRWYVVACIVRWCAWAAFMKDRGWGPVMTSDYDVINRGFSPDNAAGKWKVPTVVHPNTNPSNVYFPDSSFLENVVEMLTKPTKPRVWPSGENIHDGDIFEQHWKEGLDEQTARVVGEGHETAMLWHFPTRSVPQGENRVDFVRRVIAEAAAVKPAPSALAADISPRPRC